VSENPTKPDRRPSRFASKALGAGREPEPGTQFPSAVFGYNLNTLRHKRRLSQAKLATLMNQLGFAGWTHVTVSDVERGVRSTGVDELFGLAIALGTYVITLLDPLFSGDQEPGVDLGVPLPDDLRSEFARRFLVSEEDPWQQDRFPATSYGEYRKQFEKLPNAREERIASKRRTVEDQ
jgi:transcriptional regulator with XRE-family HTH domain